MKINLELRSRTDAFLQRCTERDAKHVMLIMLSADEPQVTPEALVAEVLYLLRTADTSSQPVFGHEFISTCNDALRARGVTDVEMVLPEITP